MIGTYGWIVYSQMYSNDCGDGRVGRGETGCCGAVVLCLLDVRRVWVLGID